METFLEKEERCDIENILKMSKRVEESKPHDIDKVLKVVRKVLGEEGFLFIEDMMGEIQETLERDRLRHRNHEYQTNRQGF